MASIALLEDIEIQQFMFWRLALNAQPALAQYGLYGEPHRLSSAKAFLMWLDNQGPASVGLVVLDYSLGLGRNSVSVLPHVRTPTSQHPALHSNALVIGWSSHDDAYDFFYRSQVVDAFIAKGRTTGVIDDVLTILHRHREGEPWVVLG